MEALIAAVLFATIWWRDFRVSLKIRDKRSSNMQLRGMILSLVIISLSLYVVNYWLPRTSFSIDDYLPRYVSLLVISIILSSLISFCWYLFISWMDIYEKEKFIFLFITFVLACGSTFLVFVLTPFWDSLGLQLNGIFINDFIYSSVRIGATEELVKIVPFLIMLAFSKQIDEPIDFILFGATSALGFAFIENIIYLRSSELSALNGRVFYASVSHMFDTGIICYSLAMAQYKKQNMLVAGVIGFILASLAHGFYDFWLISPLYKDFTVTWLFFLISIHLFAIMKNNLINISQYYNPEKRLDVVLNKTRLFNILLFIMFLGYVVQSLISDTVRANEFLGDSILGYSFIMVYLVLSFNSSTVVHGYVAPLRIKNVIQALFNRQPDYLGYNVRLSDTLRGNAALAQILPIEGSLSKRLVINGDVNWYEFKPIKTIVELDRAGILILKPAKVEHHLQSGQSQIFRVALINPDRLDNEVSFKRDEIRPIGNVRVRQVTEV